MSIYYTGCHTLFSFLGSMIKSIIKSQMIRSVDISESVVNNQSISINQFYPINSFSRNPSQVNIFNLPERSLLFKETRSLKFVLQHPEAFNGDLTTQHWQLNNLKAIYNILKATVSALKLVQLVRSSQFSTEKNL